MELIYNHLENIYTEAGQNNPIRWILVEPDKEKPNIFYNVSQLFRCKDYFNDFVYKRRTKKSFTAYGFPTNKITSSEKDYGYVVITGVEPAFLSNLKLLNNWLLKDQCHSTIKVTDIDITNNLAIDKKGLLLAIPPFYLRNTYNISLLSFLIRYINQKIKYNTWQQLINSQVTGNDSVIMPRIKIKNKWFKFHPLLKKYIFYIDKGVNSDMKEPVIYKDSIHNNGCLSWEHVL